MNSSACAEVYQIIQYLPEEEYRLIPKEKIDYIKKNMDKNFKKICTFNTNIDDIKLSDEANEILLSLFYNDIANEKQKKQLEAFLLKKEQENLKKFDEREFFASKNASTNSASVTGQGIIEEDEFNSGIVAGQNTSGGNEFNSACADGQNISEENELTNGSVASQNIGGENELNNESLKTEESNEKQLIAINENSWNYKIKKFINKILEKLRIKKK